MRRPRARRRWRSPAPMPGSPSGPTRTTARVVFTTTARTAGDDRGERVLPGVERPGQDGDQRVGGEPDAGRRAASPRSASSGRPSNAGRTAAPRSRRAGSRPGRRSGSITNDEQPHGPRQQADELVWSPDGRAPATATGRATIAERHADDPDRDLEQRERDRERGDRAGPERRGERRHDDERDLASRPRPTARGAISASAWRAAGSPRSIRGRVAEADRRERPELDERGGRASRRRRRRPGRSTPRPGPAAGPPPMIARL